MFLFTRVDPVEVPFCSQKGGKKQQTKTKTIFYLLLYFLTHLETKLVTKIQQPEVKKWLLFETVAILL